MKKLFIDNSPTVHLETGVPYFATGLVVPGESSDNTVTVEYIDPFGKYTRALRNSNDITVSDMDDLDAARFTDAYRIAELPKSSTQTALWRGAGDPDPHDERYNCERANLPLGDYTDDEMTNAVYLHGNGKPNLQDVLDGKAKMPIVYLTAAKDRIRWLSRRLADALFEGQKLRVLAAEAAALFRYYEAYHCEKGTADSLKKAEVNSQMAKKLEAAVSRTSTTG